MVVRLYGIVPNSLNRVVLSSRAGAVMSEAKRLGFALALLSLASTGCGGCGSDGDPAVEADAGPDVAPPTSRTCTDADFECVVGRCKVTGYGASLKPGEKLTLEDRAAPPELAGDVTSQAMCALTLPKPVTV